MMGVILYRYMFLIIALLALVVAGVAQPAPNISWLRVSVLNADGTPYPTAPTVSIRKLFEGPMMSVVTNIDGFDTVLIGLMGGKYEINMSLPAVGLSLLNQPIELQPGVNSYVWKLESPIIVTGEFTLDGKKPVAIKKVSFVYVVNDFTVPRRGKGAAAVKNKMSLDMTKSFTVTPEGKYSLTVPYTGSYTMSIFTDQGYINPVTLVVPAGTVKTFTAPLTTLILGGNIKLTMLDVAGKPMPGTAVSFSQNPNATANDVVLALKNSVAEADFTIGFTADENGVIVTPQLPPGTYSYTYSLQIPNKKNPATMITSVRTGIITVKLGIVAEATVQM